MLAIFVISVDYEMGIGAWPSLLLTLVEYNDSWPKKLWPYDHYFKKLRLRSHILSGRGWRGGGGAWGYTIDLCWPCGSFLGQEPFVQHLKKINACLFCHKTSSLWNFVYLAKCYLWVLTKLVWKLQKWNFLLFICFVKRCHFRCHINLWLEVINIF